MYKIKFYSSLIFLILGTLYCTDFYPEVIVVNKLGPSFMIKDVSAGGCIHQGIVTYEKATIPMRCLHGEYKITFKRIDVSKYCRTQTEYGNIDGLCICDAGTPYADTDIVSPEPLWYNYATIRSYKFESGNTYTIEITIEGTEQDFSVPGPFGH